MKTKCTANSTILTGTRQRKGMNTCKVERLEGASAGVEISRPCIFHFPMLTLYLYCVVEKKRHGFERIIMQKK